MRLSTVEFKGYKRLHETKCNVDGHVIAFVGPNEVGKSSVLKGLEWLTSPVGNAMSPGDLNRSYSMPTDAMLVSARYRLDDDDFEALRSLNVDAQPAIGPETVGDMQYSRRADGTSFVALNATIGRNMTSFNIATVKLRRIDRARVLVADWLDENGVHDHESLIQRALLAIDPSDEVWQGDRLDRAQNSLLELRTLRSSLKEKQDPPPKVLELGERITEGLVDFRKALDAGSLPDPETEVRRVLSERIPRFVLFNDNDREISDTYYLADESTRESPPSSLANLLAVAGTDVGRVWEVVEGGDSARLRTLERRINETLKSRLQPMWSQSELTLNLRLNQGGLLEVNVDEINSADFTVTPIAERSDGLRAFFGLVCFLTANDLEIPPVLMIDEAERNLHYDAQGDLMRVLTNDLRVSKVLYTTHSPGCLPLDLGTGIRVVKRDESDPRVSVLENNFWISSDPGFSRLLFAMGAEAAAFSAFRRAVLAEGVSEMILLPTLLRNATAGVEIDFQVAFGLSNMTVPQALNEVALVTTFLVDGDAAGTAKSEQLLAAGVPSSHVLQLPEGKAIEDLVDPSSYVEVVNGLLAEQSKSLRYEDLDQDITIARAVDDYAKSVLDLPGGVSHKIVASRLAERGPNLALSPIGQTFLPDLRARLEAAFAQPYRL